MQSEIGSLNKGRIEYIDAMRGFTMILVVYSHICNYCLGDKWMGFNDIFFLFRLPCFFFISGWLFGTYQAGDSSRTMRVIKDKFMVQIVPTFIFLLILAPPPLFFSRLGATKGGYWFTFALFMFFLLHILSSWLAKRLSSKQNDLSMLGFAILISVSAFCYDVYYNRLFSNMGWITKALGFISLITWRYYLFFGIGAIIRKHFDAFIRFTDRPAVIASVILGFALFALHPRSEDVAMSYTIFTIGGVLGMTMVFTFFRKCSRFFTKRTTLGRSLQYIGTRTLDIYLLHYFFLPRFLIPYGERLQAYHQPVAELLIALILALIVVSLCLIASYILRLSPFLAKYLFGVKRR